MISKSGTDLYDNVLPARGAAVSTNATTVLDAWPLLVAVVDLTGDAPGASG